MTGPQGEVALQEGKVSGDQISFAMTGGNAKMKKSPIMDESILCGQCHGLGPNLELEEPSQCATLYGSYLMSYTADGGHEKCQECHMKKSKLGQRKWNQGENGVVIQRQ